MPGPMRILEYGASIILVLFIAAIALVVIWEKVESTKKKWRDSKYELASLRIRIRRITELTRAWRNWTNDPGAPMTYAGRLVDYEAALGMCPVCRATIEEDCDAGLHS